MRSWLPALFVVPCLALLAIACTEPGDSFLTIEGTGAADASGDSGGTGVPAGAYDWDTDIVPILAARGCLDAGCHGNGSAASGLSLESLDTALAGGSHGAGIVPCDPGGSPIVGKTSESPPFGSPMPLGKEALSAEEHDILTAWVAEGADTVDCAAGGGIPAGEYDFTDDILPILGSHGCTAQFCHGAGSASSGLNAETLEGLLTGGVHGAAVVPCAPQDSPLYTKTVAPPPFGTLMPLGSDWEPLTDAERAVLAAWIAEGADSQACDGPVGGDDPDATGGGDPDATGSGAADDAGPLDTGPDDTGPDDTGPDDTGPDDTGADDTGPASALTWDADIKPLLDTYGCTWSGCHTGTVSSGLSLGTYQGALTGGLHGAAVVPCDTAASIMLDKIGGAPTFGQPMPLGGDPVSAADLATIQEWIAGGADEGSCD